MFHRMQMGTAIRRMGRHRSKGGSALASRQAIYLGQPRVEYNSGNGLVGMIRRKPVIRSSSFRLNQLSARSDG